MAAELGNFGLGVGLLANGGALLEEASRRFGDDTIDAVAASLLALGEDGLVVFDDSSESIDQISHRHRIALAGAVRLTARGDQAEKRFQKFAGIAGWCRESRMMCAPNPGAPRGRVAACR